jgi:hypothetical protein
MWNIFFGNVTMSHEFCLASTFKSFNEPFSMLPNLLVGLMGSSNTNNYKTTPPIKIKTMSTIVNEKTP